jgi:hypothetical protein
VDWELGVPVVRDNLEALGLINVPEAKLLDFGCGNGHYQSLLSACSYTAKWDYIGVDTRLDFVQFCRQTYHKIYIETVEEGSALPFADNEFDIGPRSRRRPLSVTQHNPTTSLVGISFHCHETGRFA